MACGVVYFGTSSAEASDRMCSESDAAHDWRLSSAKPKKKRLQHYLENHRKLAAKEMYTIQDEDTRCKKWVAHENNCGG